MYPDPACTHCKERYSLLTSGATVGPKKRFYVGRVGHFAECLIDSLNASRGLGTSYTLAMQFLLFATWKKSFNAKVKKLLRPRDPGLQNIPEHGF